MKKLMVVLIGVALLAGAAGAGVSQRGSTPEDLKEQTRREQRHFVECLAAVYSPEWWVSYNGSLYFQPRDQAQAVQLEAMKTARAAYVALTNREARHAIAARLIAASGVGEEWQKKLLLPYSATNQNLTPTLARQVRVVPSYKVARSFGNGDVLLDDGQVTLFVMNIGRGAGDASGTNAVLLREGTKTYAAGGSFKTVEAFENVALSPEETAVLDRVAAACRKEAASLSQPAETPMGTEEFEALKARATDSNPYMQYLLAKAYLEGQGTGKSEELGMEWMRRAAKNGSGDAAAYLERLGKTGL